ncbi:MAG: T9SS type A sorting domain-containing protein [Bacteroidia bacterium]
MKRHTLLILFLPFFLFAFAANSQSAVVKIMTWNLLNYPDYTNVSSDTALRNPYYRTVVQYVNPDILVTQENATNSSVSLFLSGVMNVGGSNQYNSGTYINGYDTNNGIFYRAADFQFVSNTVIATDLRDINAFKLVHILTGDTILIYSCHLKSSYGPPNDTQRASEVDSLRKVTNVLSSGTDFIVCGDFNIYNSFEGAYIKLLQNNIADDGNFIDIYSMPGTWNQLMYSNYHTQSTRLTNFGGGASGGMNDRFDMILYSTAVSQPGKVTYVSGSMTPVGNDGLHYNQSINVMPNTTVPQNVANALYNVSDHLPVTANFEFSSTTNLTELSQNSSSINIFPDPAVEDIFIQFYSRSTGLLHISIYNILGNTVKEFDDEKKEIGYFEKNITDLITLQPGVYLIRLSIRDQVISKRFVIASHL